MFWKIEKYSKCPARSQFKVICGVQTCNCLESFGLEDSEKIHSTMTILSDVRNPNFVLKAFHISSLPTLIPYFLLTAYQLLLDSSVPSCFIACLK